jgi:hypothetical protein
VKLWKSCRKKFDVWWAGQERADGKTPASGSRKESFLTCSHLALSFPPIVPGNTAYLIITTQTALAEQVGISPKVQEDSSTPTERTSRHNAAKMGHSYGLRAGTRVSHSSMLFRVSSNALEIDWGQSY